MYTKYVSAQCLRGNRINIILKVCLIKGEDKQKYSDLKTQISIKYTPNQLTNKVYNIYIDNKFIVLII